MILRLRLSFFLAAFFVFSFAVLGQANALQVIPDGIDIVLAVSNHASLPLQDLVTNNPMIPSKNKEMFGNFVKAVSFNPLSDITSIQVMGQIANKAVLIVATGKFDSEKLMAQLKLVGENKMESSKINDLPAIVSKDGKDALCFLDASTVVAGTPDLLKVFLAANTGKKSSDAYAPLLAKASDKAYFTVMASGNALGKAILTAIEEKAQKRQLPPGKEALRGWCHKYFLSDITGKSLFAQQLDDKFELWATYDRSDSKDCTYHFLSENTDPHFRIDNAFKELLKTLAALPAPVEKDKMPATDGKIPAKEGE